jgi:hypothetical protein
MRAAQYKRTDEIISNINFESGTHIAGHNTFSYWSKQEIDQIMEKQITALRPSS